MPDQQYTGTGGIQDIRDFYERPRAGGEREETRPRNLGIIEMLRRIEAGEGALLPPAIEFEIDAEESYVAERTPRHPLHRLVTGLRRLGYDHCIDRTGASRSDVFRFRIDPQRHEANLRRHFGYPSPRGPSFYDEYRSARENRYTFTAPSPSFADADAAVLAHRLAMANTGRFPRVDPTPRPSPPPVINPAPPPAAPQPLPYNPKGSRRISA